MHFWYLFYFTIPLLCLFNDDCLQLEKNYIWFLLIIYIFLLSYLSHMFHIFMNMISPSQYLTTWGVQQLVVHPYMVEIPNKWRNRRSKRPIDMCANYNDQFLLLLLHEVLTMYTLHSPENCWASWSISTFSFSVLYGDRTRVGFPTFEVIWNATHRTIWPTVIVWSNLELSIAFNVVI